ncbi:MAG: hypothetical protein DI536_10670 [Archangium gephyra]|uniref:ADP-ribosylglycohydrolase n=1 Tax=Archangium gephyra TaxID=48 RepID=A0A2W5TG96_9BACT|nr:MAG: hypothetical protein DI536_10670 [Archangium gephyra]
MCTGVGSMARWYASQAFPPTIKSYRLLTMSTRQQKARGVLWGQAVGDALGTTVEFRAEASVLRRAERDWPREIIGGGPFRLVPGQVTDDTELALALNRTLVRCGGYDDDEVARAYVAWLASEPPDRGNATTMAFGRPVPGDDAAAQVRAGERRHAGERLVDACERSGRVRRDALAARARSTGDAGQHVEPPSPGVSAGMRGVRDDHRRRAEHRAQRPRVVRTRGDVRARARAAGGLDPRAGARRAPGVRRRESGLGAHRVAARVLPAASRARVRSGVELDRVEGRRRGHQRLRHRCVVGRDVRGRSHSVTLATGGGRRAAGAAAQLSLWRSRCAG